MSKFPFGQNGKNIYHRKEQDIGSQLPMWLYYKLALHSRVDAPVVSVTNVHQATTAPPESGGRNVNCDIGVTEYQGRTGNVQEALPTRIG